MKRMFALLAIGFLTTSTTLAQPYTTEFSQGEIVIDTVKRTSEDTLLIKGTVRNTSQEGYSWYTSTLLQSNVFSIKVQDMKAKKQYEQVKVKDQLVGSNHTGTLAKGESAKIWARVTAPPADSKEVSIVFSGDALPIDAATISQ